MSENDDGDQAGPSPSGRALPEYRSLGRGRVGRRGEWAPWRVVRPIASSRRAQRALRRPPQFLARAVRTSGPERDAVVQAVKAGIAAAGGTRPA